MGKKGPTYTIYGGPSEYSESAKMHEMERVNSDVLWTLRDIGVTFPVNSKQEFLSAIRQDRPTLCNYRGRALSLKELIGSLRDSDFPLKSLAEAAMMLAAACPIYAESPESAPETRPL